MALRIKFKSFPSMNDWHLIRQHEVLSYCEAVTNLMLFDSNKSVTIQMYDGHSLNQFLVNPRWRRIDDSVDFLLLKPLTATVVCELRPATPYWKSSSNTLRSSAVICDTFLPAKDALIACFSSSVILPRLTFFIECISAYRISHKKSALHISKRLKCCLFINHACFQHIYERLNDGKLFAISRLWTILRQFLNECIAWG